MLNKKAQLLTYEWMQSFQKQFLQSIAQNKNYNLSPLETLYPPYSIVFPPIFRPIPQNVILQKSSSQKAALSAGGLCLVYNYITIFAMSSASRKNWAFEGDLESYSFDDFYEKNESPIQDEAGFGIELSHDHIPFQCEQALLDTRMETIESDHSRTAKETEDIFFLEDLASQYEPLHRSYEDPPNHPNHSQNTPNEQTAPQGKEKKIKKSRNLRKNQYDKNIFANINAVILKKIVAPEAQLQLRTYCLFHKVLFEDFHSYFLNLERSKFRLGTTELSNFYESPQVEGGWKQVFGMFCVRFLREEYVQYVVREGRMQEREKYLVCATKMMYIPRLRQEEYHIISCLVNKVIDI